MPSKAFRLCVSNGAQQSLGEEKVKAVVFLGLVVAPKAEKFFPGVPRRPVSRPQSRKMYRQFVKPKISSGKFLPAGA